MGLLVRRLQEIRAFNRVIQASESAYLLGRSRSYCSNFSNGPEHKPWGISSFLYKGQNALPWTQGSTMTLRSTMAVELSIFLDDKRLVTTQARPPPQARQMAGLKVAISSPGLVYEPYVPRERISFWKRCFTKSGWRRTKEDIILELKSAYAIAKLRKTGYTKQQFYLEAIELYKEINTLLANGDKTTIRKAVTEKMYSELKNEIKQRESRWNKIYWEMIEPVIKIRTLRARLASIILYLICLVYAVCLHACKISKISN
uniref:Large ribosomal subunit protein mL45 n=1 Tax=Rhizophora mucronata TaxID=61149 RepID=A0A2P2KI63_RHIMU